MCCHPRITLLSNDVLEAFIHEAPFELNVAVSPNGRLALCMTSDYYRPKGEEWSFMLDTAFGSPRPVDLFPSHFRRSRITINNDGEISVWRFQKLHRFRVFNLRNDTWDIVHQAWQPPLDMTAAVPLNNGYLLGLNRWGALEMIKNGSQGPTQQFMFEADGYVVPVERMQLIGGRVNADASKLFAIVAYEFDETPELGFDGRPQTPIVHRVFRFLAFNGQMYYDLPADEGPIGTPYILNEDYVVYPSRGWGDLTEFVLAKIVWEPRLHVQVMRRALFNAGPLDIVAAFEDSVVVRRKTPYTTKYCIWRLRRPCSLLLTAHRAALNLPGVVPLPKVAPVEPVVAGTIKYKDYPQYREEYYNFLI